MRVVFVGVGAEQISVELLAAVLAREGHEVRLAFNPSLFNDRFQMDVPLLARLFDRDAETIDTAVRLRPDVVAMSVLTNTYRWCLDTARAIKARTGARVIFGGVHPSAVPEVVIEEAAVDAVCIGEGDHAFPAYLRALEAGRLDAPIPNLWHKRPDGSVVRGAQAAFEQDLDTLPFPDKSLYEDEVSIRDLYMTITGRGCPYRCTFCFNNFWAKLPSRSGVRGGRYVRQRSVDSMIAELLQAKRRYGIRFVDFEDDVFTVDKAWIERFLGRYRREIAVPFMCLTHPKYVDEDIVRWLKEAGCTWVQIGIQSVDEHYKHKALKRYEKAGDVAWAIDAFGRAGIGVKGDHIFGSPGEGLDAQESARVFYAEHTPARIGTFWMTYYPAVEITTEALRRGDLTEEDVRRLADGHVPAYHEHGAVQDPDQLRALRAYEVLFRLMPALPRSVRGRVPARWFEPLPQGLLSGLSMGVDIAVGFAEKNPDHLLYAQHYVRQMMRHAGRALGLVAGVPEEPAAAPRAKPPAPSPAGPSPRAPGHLPVMGG